MEATRPDPAIAVRDILLDARRRYPRAAMERLEDLCLRLIGKEERFSSPDPMQRPGIYCPGLRAAPWWDASEFEAVSILESSWKSIRNEVLNARQVGFQKFNDGTPHSGTWAALYLRFGARPVDDNRQLCPETYRIVNSLPRVGELGMISALTAGTHIEPHCGLSNFKLTAHLGLQIPPGCLFRVSNETRAWQEGKCVVFDDSFEHEVWNNSESTRWVLLVDLWHPDLTDVEVDVLNQMEELGGKLRSRLSEGLEFKGTKWWDGL